MGGKGLNIVDTTISFKMAEREHVVIHLHPQTLKQIRRLVRKYHYENVEHFIIDAIAGKILILRKEEEK